MNKALKTIRLYGGGTELLHEDGGVYFTQVLDSQQAKNVWHRMSLRFEKERTALFRISIYASDERKLTYKNQVKTIDEVLKLEPCEQKEGFLSSAFVKSFENPTDILLHDTVGRFLWCKLEVFGERSVTFKLITVKTPSQSFVKLLPEIYQTNTKDDFVDKYLSIFQTLYEDFEEEIYHSGALYEPLWAPIEFVKLLCDWFGLEDKLLWQPAKLRNVLKSLHFLNKTRGTLRSLELIVELFCSVKPYFVEAFHTMRYYEHSKNDVFKRLYSFDRFTLFVMVFKENMSDKTENILRYLLEKYKPVHIKIRLVILKPFFILDTYTYLGINSMISKNSQAELNGQSMLGYNLLK